ncbi:MAG: preprotein translocase subunit YajC [Synergistaceae bacterium]|jgi:preprotein translocase subunit YajC|nr:preprotein translocase subunit YajC [Synergistaceae bacterium]
MADQAPATTPAVTSCGGFGGFGGFGGSGSSSSGAGAAPEGGAPAGGAQGIMGMLFPLAIFILIFYFFIIRPQRKRQKQHDTLIGGITRGDQVITIGGFLGTVREVRDDTFVVEIADGVKVRVLKSAVQTKRATPAPTTEEKKEKE